MVTPGPQRKKKAPSGKTPPKIPLTDTEIETIKALHGQGKGRNEIAREVGRSTFSVTKAIKNLGLAFDESATVEATAARVAKMNARRVDLAEILLDDVTKIHQRLWSPHQYYERGPDSLIPVTLPLPPLKDLASGYGALSTALKGHVDLLSGSDSASIDSKRSVLATLIAGIKATVASDKASGVAAPDMSLPDSAGQDAEATAEGVGPPTTEQE